MQINKIAAGGRGYPLVILIVLASFQHSSKTFCEGGAKGTEEFFPGDPVALASAITISITITIMRSMH